MFMTIMQMAITKLIEKETDKLSLIILKSFKEYIDSGNKLSNLTWFKDIKDNVQYAENNIF